MAERILSFLPLEFASPFSFVAASALIILVIFLPGIAKKRLPYFPLGFWKTRIDWQNKKVLIVPALLILGSIFLAFLFAGPQQTQKITEAQQYGKPLMVVIDVSGSMGGQNYERSLQVFRGVTQQNLRASVGLVLYSNDAYIAREFAPTSQLLTDTIENRAEVERISLGTETANALSLVRSFFAGESPEVAKTILLISDLDDDLQDVAREINENSRVGITFFTIVVEEKTSIAQERIAILQQYLGADRAMFVLADDKAGMEDLFQTIRQIEGVLVISHARGEKESLLPILLLSFLGLALASLLLSETTMRKIP